MKTIVFVNLSSFVDTPMRTPESTYVRRMDISTPLENPGDPKEVREVVLKLWKDISPELNKAVEGGDDIVIALPGSTLMSAAISSIADRSLQAKVGFITATREGDSQYVFDLNPSRILRL